MAKIERSEDHKAGPMKSFAGAVSSYVSRSGARTNQWFGVVGH
jgi:hypothetical protein